MLKKFQSNPVSLHVQQITSSASPGYEFGEEGISRMTRADKVRYAVACILVLAIVLMFQIPPGAWK